MRRTKLLYVFILNLAAWTSGAETKATRPAILYTDLDSGPNRGGDGGAGVYVTIYGTGFGQAQGSSTVTIGGGAAFSYNLWSNTKVIVQLGPAARTGSVVVHTAAGDSEGVSFTVRGGNIFFVAPGGVDTSSGISGRPWRTIQHAVETIRPGDVVYVMDGVVETRPGSSDGSVEIASSGSPGLPKTLAAFPGATAIIGSPGSGVCASDHCVEGLVTLDVGTPYTDWTIAGLTFRGNNKAFLVTGGARPNNLSNRWRVIGNDFSCPNIHSLSGPGCVTFAQTQNILFHGNRVHDVGHPGDEVQEYGQGLYFTTDTVHIDAGWNVVANVKGCRCVQVHSSPLGNGDSTDATGYNQFDISIHDNVIHDCGCDGLLLWSVDPSRGPISVYNNVIYNAGAGPAPRSGSGNFSCLYMAATTNNSGAPPASGTVEVYNNTVFNCGGANVEELSMAIRSGGEGENPNVLLRLRNNIVQVSPRTPYISAQGNRVIGSNNLWFGAGPPPPNDSYVSITSNLNSDPLFVNPARGDFHLRPGSPAVNAGLDTGLAMDADGLPRHRTPAMDLGAYEHAGPPRIGLFSCEPAVIKTPGRADCIVILAAEATDGAVVITLASDNSMVSVPASVTVPGGGSSAGFQVFAPVMFREQTVTLTASTPEQAEIFRLSLVPPAATLSVSVNSLSFTQQLNGPAPASQTLTVTGTGGSITFAATPSVNQGLNWLTVSPATDITTPATLTVSVNGAELQPNTYTGQIVLSSPGAASSQTILVTLIIVNAPTITVSPTSLSPVTFQIGSANPQGQTIAVALFAGGAAAFSATPITVAGGNWLSVSPTAGTAPQNIVVTINPAGLAASATPYQGWISIVVPGATNSPLTLPISLTVTPAAVIAPVIAAVQNGASYIPTSLSPGLNIIIYGTNMGPATLTNYVVGANGALATTVAGTQVTFDGIPAPIIYTSSTVGSVMVPYGVAGRVSTAMVVTYNGVSSTPLQLRLVDAAPGIYTINQTGTGQGAILNENGTVNSAANPESAGHYIQIYGTGEGATSPQGVDGAILPGRLPLPAPNLPVTVIIGGIPIAEFDVNYAGEAPNLISGVIQVNAKIPAGVGPGPVAVVIKVGGAASQANVTVSVR